MNKQRGEDRRGVVWAAAEAAANPSSALFGSAESDDLPPAEEEQEVDLALGSRPYHRGRHADIARAQRLAPGRQRRRAPSPYPQGEAERGLWSEMRDSGDEESHPSESAAAASSTDEPGRPPPQQPRARLTPRAEPVRLCHIHSNPIPCYLCGDVYPPIEPFPEGVASEVINTPNAHGEARPGENWGERLNGRCGAHGILQCQACFEAGLTDEAGNPAPRGHRRIQAKGNQKGPQQQKGNQQKGKGKGQYGNQRPRSQPPRHHDDAKGGAKAKGKGDGFRAPRAHSSEPGRGAGRGNGPPLRDRDHGRGYNYTYVADHGGGWGIYNDRRG